MDVDKRISASGLNADTANAIGRERYGASSRMRGRTRSTLLPIGKRSDLITVARLREMDTEN
jgi:hypothetical protein